jgi:hypothetical protein
MPLTCGGTLSGGRVRATQIVRGFMSGEYLLDTRWHATKFCGQWETGISDWWYEQEYIDWLRKVQAAEKAARESSPEWRLKQMTAFVALKTTDMTANNAAAERARWDSLVLQCSKHETCEKHSCGAMVVPDGISSTKNVCWFCDFQSQPFIANPMFAALVQTTRPELVAILYDVK